MNLTRKTLLNCWIIADWSLYESTCGAAGKKLKRAVYLFYLKPPTDAQLEAVGLSRSDYEGEDPPEVIFDESMFQSWDLFCAMQTQWRSTSGSVYGFDYNVLPMLFDIYKIEDREMALNDLRIMEQKALEMIHSNKT